MGQTGASASATLDFDALRSVVAIADLGGVTAAAGRVGRTPAAISMQLKKLEETLGRPLFERGKRMTPTPAGERLLGYARRMVGLHADAIAAFRHPGLTGEVRLGLIEEAGPARLSDALAGFAEAHPEVVVAAEVGASRPLTKALGEGRLDLAIVTHGESPSASISEAVLMAERLVWVGAENGAAHLREPLPLALSAAGCAWRRAALDCLERAGRGYRIAFLSDAYAFQAAAVSADLAIAPFPISALNDGLWGNVRPLGAEDGLPALGPTELALRWLAGATANPARDALAERLKAAFCGACRL